MIPHAAISNLDSASLIRSAFIRLAGWAMKYNSWDDLRKLIDTTDSELFGSDTADSENAEELSHYFVEFPEFDYFLDERKNFQIARARKGVGKSALLKQAAFLMHEDSDVLVIELTGSNFIQFFNVLSTDANGFIQGWQQAIASCVLEKYSGTLSRPKTQIELFVMRKYSNYSPRRNLISTILSRVEAVIPFIKSVNISEFSPLSLLEALLEHQPSLKIWISVDDIDSTFRDKEDEKLLVSTFFTAARGLSSRFSQINIRASVRKDVWTTIRSFDEALDKCQQNLIDIEWSDSGTLWIISNRIRNYIRKKAGPEATFSGHARKILDSETKSANQHVLNLAFPEYFPWGTENQKAYLLLHILSGGRPRWGLQLCKMAGRQAGKMRSKPDSTLKISYFRKELPAYSRSRLQDIIIEFRHQCRDVGDIIYAFDNKKFDFETHELLSEIDRGIMKYMDVKIDGMKVRSNHEIAAFLFRIGFLNAVNKNNNRMQYRFEDMPHFFRTLPADHSYVKWEISPSFRHALVAQASTPMNSNNDVELDDEY